MYNSWKDNVSFVSYNECNQKSVSCQGVSDNFCYVDWDVTWINECCSCNNSYRSDDFFVASIPPFGRSFGRGSICMRASNPTFQIWKQNSSGTTRVLFMRRSWMHIKYSRRASFSPKMQLRENRIFGQFPSTSFAKPWLLPADPLDEEFCASNSSPSRRFCKWPIPVWLYCYFCKVYHNCWWKVSCFWNTACNSRRIR